MDKLERYEQMQADVMKQYRETETAMAQLKAEGKIKTATYRQLFANKMMLTELLSLYKRYGLEDK
ncbi:MAG: hypothetical protein MJ099_05865 [Clostridia bacterium]|nr:hypothetical protein [Clostridia bacterium]